MVCRYSPAGNRLQDRYFLPRALGKNTCKSEGKVGQKKKLKFKTVATEALAHPMGSSEGGMAFQRYLFFFFFFGHPAPYGVPRPGIKSKLHHGNP